MDAILHDYRTAPIDQKLRTTLGFLEKLTLWPEEVTTADLIPMRVAGVSDVAIEEAIQVCFLFCLIDKIADALDFTLPTPCSLHWVGRILVRIGYQAACLPG